MNECRTMPCPQGSAQHKFFNVKINLTCILKMQCLPQQNTHGRLRSYWTMLAACASNRKQHVTYIANVQPKGTRLNLVIAGMNLITFLTLICSVSRQVRRRFKLHHSSVELNSTRNLHCLIVVFHNLLFSIVCFQSLKIRDFLEN